jgi:carbonic anhydrase/acetyltransferase-like protein (isoleucine patch superfamily)
MIYALDDREPVLHPDVWVADSARVIGDVVLDEGASVWFGAVLRGDNERISIGARSNVQENCVLHTDIGFPMEVGADCTIGHGVVLHGCTIGPESLIGMGATVLNGARIGRNCLVGAGALVTEGKVFPDGSLIMGTPARIVRSLGAEELLRFKLSAAHYVENARRFRAGLRPV